MNKCRMCGAQNDDTAESCQICNARLTAQGAVNQNRRLSRSLRIRSTEHMKAWVLKHRDGMRDGEVAALDVVNSLVTGGQVSAAELGESLRSGEPLPYEVGLSKEMTDEMAAVVHPWFDEGDAASAQPVFVALNLLKPSAYLENMIGACAAGAGDNQEALKHYTRAVKLDLHYMPARKNHVDALFAERENIDGFVALVMLSSMNGTKEERSFAAEARESLTERWERILEIGRNSDDPDQRTGAAEIVAEVQPVAQKMGIYLADLYTPAERLEKCRSFIQSMKGMGIPLTETEIQAMEAEALKCRGCGRQLKEGEECAECAKKKPARTVEDWLRRMEVFVSYRRQDTGAHVKPVVGALRKRFDCEYFIDEGGIEAGEDYVRKLRNSIETAGVFLEFIGPNWLTPRLQEQDDVLRREVEWALAKERKIIPVLVEGARMPDERSLPEDMRPLARIQAHAIRMASVDEDLDALAERIREILLPRAEDVHGLFEALRGPKGADNVKIHVAVFYDGFPMNGAWEVTISPDQLGNPAGVKSKFRIEEGNFSGTWSEAVTDQFGAATVEDYEVEGSCQVELEEDEAGSKVITALILDGVSGAQAFSVTIPIGRRLGEGYQGEDEEGCSYFLKPVGRQRAKAAF